MALLHGCGVRRLNAQYLSPAHVHTTLEQAVPIKQVFTI